MKLRTNVIYLFSCLFLLSLFFNYLNSNRFSSITSCALLLDKMLPKINGYFCRSKNDQPINYFYQSCQIHYHELLTNQQITPEDCIITFIR